MKYSLYSMAAIRILEVIGRHGTLTEEWIEKITGILVDELTESSSWRPCNLTLPKIIADGRGAPGLRGLPDPISLINTDIDRLRARLPDLPAWAAHQVCGWSWEAKRSKTGLESAEAYLDEARAESEYAHSEEAHHEIRMPMQSMSRGL